MRKHLRLAVAALALAPLPALAQTQSTTPQRIPSGAYDIGYPYVDGAGLTSFAPGVFIAGGALGEANGSQTSATLDTTVVGNVVTLAVPAGATTLAVRMASLSSSGATVTFQGAPVGNYSTNSNASLLATNAATGVMAYSETTNGTYLLNVAGMAQVVVYVSAAGTNAALPVNAHFSSAPSLIFTTGNSTQRGGSNIATGQVSVTTSSTLIAAARPSRQRITVSVGAANACAFGNTGVTTTTGFPLQPTPGASVTLDTAAALYAVCSATTTISYVELY